MSGSMRGVWTTGNLVRHRQTKGAATDRVDLKPPASHSDSTTVDHTPVYTREVVKRALELQASALILVHNHPSGDPTPSKADIAVTKDIVKAAAPLNVTVHDHLIIGRGRHSSLRDLGLI